MLHPFQRVGCCANTHASHQCNFFMKAKRYMEQREEVKNNST